MGKLDLVLVDEIFSNLHTESAIFFNFKLNALNISYSSYILQTTKLKSKRKNSSVVVECKNSWEIRVNVYLGKGLSRGFNISRRQRTQLALRNLNLCSEFLTEQQNSRKGRPKNFGVLGWTSLYLWVLRFSRQHFANEKNREWHHIPVPKVDRKFFPMVARLFNDT